jgi:hypothetical protein
LKEKTKRKLARGIGLGLSSGIYFFMIYIFFAVTISDIIPSPNDRGIILEIIGFVLYFNENLLTQIQYHLLVYPGRRDS